MNHPIADLFDHQANHEEDLNMLWMAMHREPAWLSRSVDHLGLSSSDEEFLANLDESLVTGRLEQKWMAGIQRDISDWLEEIAPKRVRAGQVSDSDIDKANLFPMETIVEMKNGYALCLWHDDTKPSMLYKNNFFHCFSCHKTASPISYFMRLRGLTFPDAVRAMK